MNIYNLICLTVLNTILQIRNNYKKKLFIYMFALIYDKKKLDIY